MTERSAEAARGAGWRATVLELIGDALICGGIVGLTYGAGMVYDPAAYLVGGACATVVGYGFGREAAAARRAAGSEGGSG